MNLRPYQLDAIQQTRDRIAAGRKAPLLVAPTGAGKTVIEAEIVRRHLEISPGNRVLVVAHRRELIEQIANTIRKFGINNIGLISPNHTYRPNALVQVASTQTLRARNMLPAATLILYDEAHHYSSDDWHELTKAYPNVLRLGFTATPIRSDGRGMAPAFDSLVVVSTIKELTQQGHLVPCKVIAPAIPLKRPAMSHSPVDAYLAHANGMRTVVFADFIVNAEKFVDEFHAKDVHAVIVHGKLNDTERKEAFAEHAKGAVLVNCMVLTEGWDSPETSCCILARGCGSVGTYLQIVGRVLRPFPGKTQAILIDLTGRSFYQHGPPDEDRIYSLEGKGIRSKGDGEQVYCPVCGQPVEAPPNSWPCGMCGHVQEGANLVEEPTYTGDELAERYALKREEDNGQRVETLSRWFAEVQAKGHKEWSAIAKYKAVYGVAPSDTIKASALRKSKDLSCAKCVVCAKIVARTYDGGKCGKCAFEKKGAA